jgi:hypothetical protein
MSLLISASISALTALDIFIIQKTSSDRIGLVSHRKPRQIIVRLSDPSVKIRLMKCRKNLEVVKRL